MRKSAPSLVCALVLALCVPGPSASAANNWLDRFSPAAVGLNPDQIEIRNVVYSGSGCAPGTAAIDVASDKTAFTLIFSEFLAQFGPGVPLPESRKNCQVNLTIHLPTGFTFAIAAVDYRGFANLAKGSQGQQKAIFYFQGQSPQATTWRAFGGPFNNDWHLRDEVEVASLVFAPCGIDRSLNVNAQVQAIRGTAKSDSAGFMTMDSEDGSIQQIFHFAFKTCPHP
jgi:hypothetical protein